MTCPSALISSASIEPPAAYAFTVSRLPGENRGLVVRVGGLFFGWRSFAGDSMEAKPSRRIVASPTAVFPCVSTPV